jgi:hypothetical protein
LFRSTPLLLVLPAIALMVTFPPAFAPADTPKRSAPDASRRILVILVTGDSIDFRLVDPAGRIAVIAVDSAMTSIPDCDVEKSDAVRDHDDSDFDPDTATVVDAHYGGGTFALGDPAAGRWLLEAIAARGCLDSCEVTGVIWDAHKQMNVNAEIRCALRPGQVTAWKIDLAPRAVRPSRTWATITQEHRVKSTRPPKGR